MNTPYPFLRRIIREFVRREWPLHVLFWVPYRAYTTFFLTLEMPTYPIWFFDQLFYHVNLVSVFYVVSFIVAPQFIPTRRFRALLASLVGLFFLYAGIRYLLIYPFQPLLNPDVSLPPFSTNYKVFFVKCGKQFIDFVIFGLGYWYAKYAYKREREKRLLEQQKRMIEEQKNVAEKEKLISKLALRSAEYQQYLAEQETLRAKLAFLQSQINPHFLYNMLNYFCSLAYPFSKELTNSIIKLSHIMRYALKDNNDSLVPLTEEMSHLQEFIALYQASFKHQLHVYVQVEGQSASKRILPLVLISLVENAFKHGDLTDESDPLLIKLSSANGHIAFDIQNKKAKDNGLSDIISSTRVGNLNVQKRLELAYPGKYTLLVEEDENNYRCELILEDH